MPIALLIQSIRKTRYACKSGVHILRIRSIWTELDTAGAAHTYPWKAGGGSMPVRWGDYGTRQAGVPSRHKESRTRSAWVQGVRAIGSQSLAGRTVSALNVSDLTRHCSEMIALISTSRSRRYAGRSSTSCSPRAGRPIQLVGTAWSCRTPGTIFGQMISQYDVASYCMTISGTKPAGTSVSPERLK